METKKVLFRVDTLKSTYPSVTHNQIVNAIVKWFTERCHQAFVYLDENSNLELLMARVVSIECDSENITFELKPLGRYTDIIVESTYKIGGSWIVSTIDNEIELLNCYVVPQINQTTII